MRFADFLIQLAKAAHETHQEAILDSEANRKRHWEDKDDALHPKQTRRVVAGEHHDIPEHLVHDNHSLLVDKVEMKTAVDLFEKNGELQTRAKQRLFRRASNVKVTLTMKIGKAPEGAHAIDDAANEQVKHSVGNHPAAQAQPPEPPAEDTPAEPDEQAQAEKTADDIIDALDNEPSEETTTEE